MKPLYPEDVICPHCGVRVADHSLEGIWVCAEAWEMTKNENEVGSQPRKRRNWDD